jgi:hypothetical protein
MFTDDEGPVLLISKRGAVMTRSRPVPEAIRIAKRDEAAREFAKFQADSIEESLRDDDAYWAYRKAHDAKVRQAEVAAGFYKMDGDLILDVPMESQVQDLRDREFGAGPSCWEVADEVIATLAEFQKGEEGFEYMTRAQRYGKVLDELNSTEFGRMALNFASGIGRTIKYTDLADDVTIQKSMRSGGLPQNEVQAFLAWVEDTITALDL